MENSESTDHLSESYLEAGQYVLEGHDGEESLGSEGHGSAECGSGNPLREQDRFLPIANVARIMKKSIPTSGKIAKDAKECVQECVSEFISFITSEASERCHQEKRKTINGEDILFAMSSLGFDNYVEPLKLYSQRYRESMKSEKHMTTLDAGAIMEEYSGDEAYVNTPITSQMITNDAGQSVIFTTYHSGGTINQAAFNVIQQ